MYVQWYDPYMCVTRVTNIIGMVAVDALAHIWNQTISTNHDDADR